MIIGISLLLTTICLFEISDSINVFHRKEINKHLINGYVNRLIDVSSQLLKINTTIHMQNSGESAILGFLFAIDSKYHQHLSLISAHSERYVSYRLKMDDITIEEYQDTVFKYITFTESLLPGDIINVNIQTIFLHRIVPYPKYIKRSDSQFVKFYDDLYFYSPYFTVAQRTVVILPSENVRLYTKYKPAVKSGNIYKFGPFYNITGFTKSTLMFCFENNNPFLTVSKLLRIIMISHWGMIHVEDTVNLESKGAIDVIHRERKKPAKEIYPIRTTIPKEARNIQCHDTLGNITTSKINYSNTSIELVLWPRLTGDSWTKYSVSYILPTQNFLYYSESDFVLRMKFIDQVFPNMSIQEAEVRIVLPEGASEVMFFVPFSIFRLPNTVGNKFLDFVGRSTISALGRNLIENHVVEFELLYDFNSTSLLQKPLILASLFFVVYILFIVFHRSICNEREKND